jgi:uncharacterized membrane protein
MSTQRSFYFASCVHECGRQLYVMYLLCIILIIYIMHLCLLLLYKITKYYTKFLDHSPFFTISHFCQNVFRYAKLQKWNLQLKTTQL